MNLKHSITTLLRPDRRPALYTRVISPLTDVDQIYRTTFFDHIHAHSLSLSHSFELQTLCLELTLEAKDNRNRSTASESEKIRR